MKIKLKETRDDRFLFYKGERDAPKSPDCYTVMVKNLSYNVSWQKLKDRFYEIGNVKYAEVLQVNGISTGIGYVRFSNLSDVVRAVKYMDNSWFGGRNIVVSPHRLSDLVKMKQYR